MNLPIFVQSTYKCQSIGTNWYKSIGTRTKTDLGANNSLALTTQSFLLKKFLLIGFC